MAKTIRHLVLSVMMTALATTGWPVAAANAGGTAATRVRSTNPAIAALIVQASVQSETFRELVETINNSDGIVYVEEGACGFGVRACVAGVTKAGGNRLLWVRVERHDIDLDVMGSIGHELRHTIEVLDEPSVTSNAAMFMLYSRIGVRGLRKAFETQAAIEAGLAVRGEVQKSQRGD